MSEGNLAPSASIYHGWPRELQQLGQTDLEGLIQTAKETADASAMA